MFEDSAWTTIILRIGEAILCDIKRLVATSSLIDSLQDAIETFGIDFTEEIFFAGIIENGMRACEATTEEFRGHARIEAYHVTRIVVNAMIISRTGGTCNWSKEGFEGKRETSCLTSLQSSPVEEGVLYA